MLSPFIIAIILAYLLNPLINHFYAQGYKKWIVITLVFILFLLVAVQLTVFLVPKFLDEMGNLKYMLPKIASQTKVFLTNIQLSLEKIYAPMHGKNLPDMLAQKVYAFVESLPSLVPGMLGNIFSVLTLLILIPFITFALLLDADKLTDWIFSIFPTRYTETVLSIISEINQVMRDFLQGQAMRLFWLTLLTVGGLLYLNVDFALLFGLMAGIFNIIPILGPWLGAIPPILLVLVKGNTALAVQLAVLFVVIQILDNFFISTYYLATSVKLHFVLVLLAIMVGAELYGLMGVIVSVPVFSMIKVVVEVLYHDYQHKTALAESSGG